jgi:hypothetical protein
MESFQEQANEYISAVIPCSNSEKLYLAKKEIIEGLVKENRWTKPCVKDVQFVT